MMTFVSNVQSQGLIILGWYLPNKKYICKKVSYIWVSIQSIQDGLDKTWISRFKILCEQCGQHSVVTSCSNQAVSVLLCMGKGFLSRKHAMTFYQDWRGWGVYMGKRFSFMTHAITLLPMLEILGEVLVTRCSRL